MIKFLKKHFLLFDSLVCLILFIGCFIIDRKTKLDIFNFLMEDDKLVNFYPDLFNISVTIFLFLITSLSVLFAFSDSSKLKVLEKSELPNDMFKSFVNAIIFTGILSLFLIPTYFISYEWLFWIIYFVFLLCIARLCRVIWILTNLTFMIIKL